MRFQHFSSRNRRQPMMSLHINPNMHAIQYNNRHIVSKPVEKKPVEKKPVEKKPVEKKPVEKKPVEKKPVKKKPVASKNIHIPAKLFPPKPNKNFTRLHKFSKIKPKAHVKPLPPPPAPTAPPAPPVKPKAHVKPLPPPPAPPVKPKSNRMGLQTNNRKSKDRKTCGCFRNK